MDKIVVFGNSGAGKSTLAKKLSQELNLTHLDLDVIAWKKDQPTERENINYSIDQINQFINQQEKWVIEGCYTSLLQAITPHCNYLIFLNPGITTCINNCYSRLWEKHKYKSKEEQDEKLSLLINWIREYETREDEFSLTQHQKLFNSFTGNKIEIKS